MQNCDKHFPSSFFQLSSSGKSREEVSYEFDLDVFDPMCFLSKEMQSYNSSYWASLFFMKIQIFQFSPRLREPSPRRHIWAADGNVVKNENSRIDPGASGGPIECK